jgi:hypothetical protein
MPQTPRQRSKQLRLPNPTFSPTPLPLLRLPNKLKEPLRLHPVVGGLLRTSVSPLTG